MNIIAVKMYKAQLVEKNDHGITAIPASVYQGEIFLRHS